MSSLTPVQIEVELSDALNYMVQHYYQGAGIVQESLDHLQTTFRCCGQLLHDNSLSQLFYTLLCCIYTNLQAMPAAQIFVLFGRILRDLVTLDVMGATTGDIFFLECC